MADPKATEDNRNIDEENTRFLREQQELEAALNLDHNKNDQPAVMAGKPASEIGANAKPTSNTLPKHKDNAQDLKNEKDDSENIFTGNDTTEQQRIYNLETSGMADGLIIQNTNSSSREENPEEQREREAKHAAAMQAQQQQQLEQLYQEYNELQEQIADSQKGLTDLSSDLRASGNFEDAQIIDDVVEMKDYIVVDYKGKEHIVYRDEENESHIYVIDKESGERVYVNQMSEPDRTNAFKEFNENQRGQKTGDQDPERAVQLEISREKLANNPELLEKFRDADKKQYAAHQKADQIKENIISIEDGDTNATAASVTAAGTIASTSTDKSGTEETLKLDTPEYSLDQADTAYNQSLSAVENAALTGGTLSQEDYDKLSLSPGMSPEKLDNMMSDNKVEITGQTLGSDIDSDNTLKNALGVASNLAIFASFPILGISGLSVPSIGAPTDRPDPNVAALNYQSFADTEFKDTNAPGVEATYDAPINNGTDNIVDASDKFGQAMINQPEPGAGLTLDQIEQQRILELQQIEQQKLLAAQNDPFFGGPKPEAEQAG